MMLKTLLLAGAVENKKSLISNYKPQTWQVEGTIELR